jgi:hypothetical protein
MTEVLNASDQLSLPKSLVLDDHNLYTHHSDEPIPVDMIHDLLIDRDTSPLPRPPRLEDVDEAYARRRIKQAGWILRQLTRYEPCYYSSSQNRIAINQLAHPIQKRLAVQQYGGAPSIDLIKDIEAIYGKCSEQLEFLLCQLDEARDATPGLRANIEGSLSEFTIFLLLTRQLSGYDTDPYLVIPSTQAQDNARITSDGSHQGYDFTVVRRRDNTHIPLQVKTSTTRAGDCYPDHILVVSVAGLVDSETTSPHTLAEALYFEVSNAQSYDIELIETASKRLFNALDTYQAPSV